MLSAGRGVASGQVTDLAAGWFGRHFARTAAIAPAA
jgi:hypothetical protein